MTNGFQTIPQLAKRITISEAGLRRRVRKGEIASIQLGRDYFIAPDGVAYALEKYGNERVTSPIH